jgi:hypothetical protein
LGPPVIRRETERDTGAVFFFFYLSTPVEEAAGLRGSGKGVTGGGGSGRHEH